MEGLLRKAVAVPPKAPKRLPGALSAGRVPSKATLRRPQLAATSTTGAAAKDFYRKGSGGSSLDAVYTPGARGLAESAREKPAPARHQYQPQQDASGRFLTQRYGSTSNPAATAALTSAQQGMHSPAGHSAGGNGGGEGGRALGSSGNASVFNPLWQQADA